MKRIRLLESGTWVDRETGRAVGGSPGSEIGISDKQADSLVAADAAVLVEPKRVVVAVHEPGPKPKAERKGRRKKAKQHTKPDLDDTGD